MTHLISTGEALRDETVLLHSANETFPQTENRQPCALIMLMIKPHMHALPHGQVTLIRLKQPTYNFVQLKRVLVNLTWNTRTSKPHGQKSDIFKIQKCSSSS